MRKKTNLQLMSELADAHHTLDVALKAAFKRGITSTDSIHNWTRPMGFGHVEFQKGKAPRVVADI